MKRWGKDWSVYRTVKDIPVTFEINSIKRFKNGNNWDQYIKHTLPDKATLKHNLENVRSSSKDPEGEDYDNFVESMTANELHRVEELNEGRAAEEVRKAKNRLLPGKIRTATRETIEDLTAKEKIALGLHGEALKKSEAAAAKAVKARAGRPAYPPELLHKLALVQKAGKEEGLSRKDLKEATIQYTKTYLAEKKDAGRKAALAAAAPKVGGAAAVAAAVAAAPAAKKEEVKAAVKEAVKASSPSVGGAGAPAAAAAAAILEDAVEAAEEAVEDGLTAAEVKEEAKKQGLTKAIFDKAVKSYTRAQLIEIARELNIRHQTKAGVTIADKTIIKNIRAKLV